MAVIRSVQFDDICRVCASSSDENVEIFSSEGKAKNLWYKISECLSLIVEEKDRLPKVLCLQCIQRVDAFMEFRTLCNNSQNKLNNWLSMAITESNKTKRTGRRANANITETNLKTSLCIEAQSQGQSNTATHTLNVLNKNTQDTSIDSTITNQSHQTNNSLNGLGQFSAIPVIKTEKADSSKEIGTKAQEHLYVRNNKTIDFKNNTLEEFLKMKPNLKVTPLSKKQQQNPNIKNQQEQDEIQQQQKQYQQEQLQIQQLQQQLQHQLQHQLQQQQHLQLQLLASPIQPQHITISAPATSLIPTINGQTVPTSTTSFIQNSSNFTLDNTNTTGITTTMNSIETADENNPLRNKRPKLNLVLATPQSTQDVATNATQLSAHNITIPPQIHLQLQPNAQSTACLNQNQQTNTSVSTLFSNLALSSQAQSQHQSVTALFQNHALTPVQSAPTNVFTAPSKCYLPITIKDDATDQQFVAHIDATNLVLPTTYQVQMKLQPQLATADGQPIMQLAPTSIPATLQLTPQTLQTTTVPPFNHNNNVQTTQVLQTTLSQQQLQQQQHLHQQQLQQQHQQQQKQQQQERHQLPAPLKAHQEQTFQPMAQAKTTISSSTLNDDAKQNCQPQEMQPQQQLRNVQQQNFLPKNAQVTSQQIVHIGNNFNTNMKILGTVPTAIIPTTAEEPVRPTVSGKDIPLKQQKYTITQNDDNTFEILPAAKNLKQQIIKEVRHSPEQKPQLTKSNSNTNSVGTQHCAITVHRVAKGKATAVTNTTPHSDNRKLQSPPIHSAKLGKQQYSEPQQHQVQESIPNAIKNLPILNNQNVTIRCVSKKVNQGLQPSQQQGQQKQLINGTRSALTIRGTVGNTLTTTTGKTLSSAADASQIQVMSREAQQQRQNVQSSTTAQTTSTTTTTTTTTTTNIDINSTKANPQLLLHIDDSAEQIPLANENINVCLSNTANNIKILEKTSLKAKKSSAKTAGKSEVNGIVQTQNNNTKANIEKSLQLSLGTTKAIPPGKYIIKDMNAAKALIAAATAAASKSRQSQSSQSNITSGTTSLTRNTMTSKATVTLPKSLSNKDPINELLIKYTKNESLIPNLNDTTVTSIDVKTTTTTSSTKPPFQCSTCSKIFKKREHLVQHAKLHAGIRPFKCTVKDCEKAFSRKEHLHRHLISHTGKKMFSCDICDKPFSRKDNLSKHRRTHLDTKNINKYVCQICNKSFEVKAYYVQHKKQHQNKKISQEKVERKDEKKLPLTIPATEDIMNEPLAQLLQQQKEIQQSQQTQIQAGAQQLQMQQPQQTQQQQNVIKSQPASEIMHLQFPTSLFDNQDLNGCNTITVAHATNHRYM